MKNRGFSGTGVMIGGAVASLILAGCGGGGGGAQEGSADTVKVGVPLSLSGPVAFAGVKMRQAMELSFDELNGELDGFEVEPVWEDDRSDQATAIDVTTNLAQREQVSAIVGYTASNICEAALPVAQEYGVPTVQSDCVVPGLSDIGENIFSAVMPYDDFVTEMIGTLANDPDLEIERAGILYLQENPVFENMQKVMTEAFQANGIEVAGVEPVPSGEDADFSAQLTKLANQDIDVLGVLLLGGQSGPAIVQARQSGLQDAVIVGEQNLNSIEVLRTAGKDAANTFYPTHWTPLAEFDRNQEYIAAYEERFGEEPDTFATNGYMGVQLLGEALKEVGPPSEYGGTEEYRTAIREALAGLDEVDSVFGTGTMQLENRQVVIDSVLIRVDENGEATLYESK